jgi:deoxyribodipyrimidine photolyase-related protein
MKTPLLLFGNQLFDPRLLLKLSGRKPEDLIVFLREDESFCRRYRYHKHKLYWVLSQMRMFRTELESHGIEVMYEALDPVSQKTNFLDSILAFLSSQSFSEVLILENEDQKFHETWTKQVHARLPSLKIRILPSPMFLTTHAQFREFVGQKKRLFMKTFYEWQRKRLQILLEPKTQEPVGGQWSFDIENRKPLPKTLTPPEPFPTTASLDPELRALIEEKFSEHPGSLDTFIYPLGREGQRKHLKRFLEERLAGFGPYEDALAPHSEFVYHSVLTPALNQGLLTPDEVIRAALKEYERRPREISLSSLEGFVRQIIGWREFIRGVHHVFGDEQSKRNFFQHTRKLSALWYSGKTGIPPLDQAILKMNRYAYSHHIERLMVIGSLMLLTQIHPQEAHQWFMEMSIDSTEWVMGPNVYGMALFSDGGTFATKPYFCGSNYYRKMGGFAPGPWCEEVDGLYWRFIHEKREFLLKNPRLSMMVRTLEKMPSSKRERLWAAADRAMEKLTERVPLL